MVCATHSDKGGILVRQAQRAFQGNRLQRWREEQHYSAFSSRGTPVSVGQ